MSCTLSKETLAQFKAFINLCKAMPEILNNPELGFFKGFIESLGGKVPAPKMQEKHAKTETNKDIPREGETRKEIPCEPKSAPIKEELDSESELELVFSTESCVQPDVVNEELQVMGDPSKKVTEEETEQADEKRVQAMTQIEEDNLEKAIELFGEAILLNPQSALLFAKRGQTYLKLSKPNACIKDCSRALELNCDSAAAYKFRGRAYRLLGDWEKAARDLRQAAKIDYDEQTDEWLKEVQPNAHRIEQHRLKQERIRLEQEEYNRLQRIKLAKEAKIAATNPNLPPGMAGVYKLLQDPEILAAFQDPEVTDAFQEITTNPAIFPKYQTNPKVRAVIAKLSEKIQADTETFPPHTNTPASTSLPTETSDKLPTSTDKPPTSTDKPPTSTDKPPTSTDKPPKTSADDDALD